jgi:hypothetical protein
MRHNKAALGISFEGESTAKSRSYQSTPFSTVPEIGGDSRSLSGYQAIGYSTPPR